MAKAVKASKASKTVKAKPASKAGKTAKTAPAAKSMKAAKTVKAKPVKNTTIKASAPKAKKEGGSRRLVSDAKIAKLQKMYKSGKHSAQSLCDEFGISMATLFNYLKVQV